MYKLDFDVSLDVKCNYQEPTLYQKMYHYSTQLVLRSMHSI